MASLQDPVLSYRVGAPYAARVYDAAPAPQNRALLQGPLKKVYSILKVYAVSPKIHSYLRHHSVYESSHNSHNKFWYKIHVCWQNTCILPTVKIYGGYLQMLTIVLDCSQLILL